MTSKVNGAPEGAARMVRSVKNNLPAIPTTPIFSHTARTVAFPNSSGSSTRLDFEPV